MKKINYALLLLFTGAMVFVSSCKKDDIPTLATLECQLIKVNRTYAGTSIRYVLTYDSVTNQVIDMQANDGKYTSGIQYSYSTNGWVSKIEKYVDSSKDVIHRIAYTYDVNGVIEENIYIDSNGGPLMHDAINRYEYHNGKRSRKNSFSLVGGQEVKFRYADYSYNTDGK